MSNSVIVDKTGLPREARRRADTSFDRIWKYYYSDKQIALSDKEEEMRQRWELAWFHLSGLMPKRLIAKRISKKFQINDRTAYNDIKHAELLFPDTQIQTKKAHRAIMLNIVETQLRRAINDKNDKAIERYMLRYRQFAELDKEDHPLAEFIKNRVPVKIEFSIDKETLKEQADLLMEGVEDVDYEDLTTDEPELDSEDAG